MKKVHIGLDLGIASVGWSIVDSSQEIIATGSHLFPKLSDPKDNKKYGEGTRGQIRRTRRALNRRKQRKIDFLNMIDLYNDNQQLKIKNTGKPSTLYKENYQNIFGFTENNSSSKFLFEKSKKYDVYKIWEKGLKNEINPKELFCFLYFKLAFRGVFFIPFDFDENIKYTYNESLLKTKFIDVYFLNNRKYRNKSNADDVFSIYHNWMDIELVLKNCSYISQEFINDYQSIFMRHRDFSKGPTNFKIDKKTNQPIIFNNNPHWGIKYDLDKSIEENLNKNIWDEKIGICPISLVKNKGNEFKAKKRLNRYFFVGELVNIISQLVYVKYGNSISDSKKLTKKDIVSIINQSLIKGEAITKTRVINFIKEIYKIKEIELFSYPTTKDGQDHNFEKMSNLLQYFKTSKTQKQIISNIGSDFNIENNYEALMEIDKFRFNSIVKYFEIDKSKNEQKTQNRDIKKSIYELKKEIKDIKYNFEISFDELANFKNVSNEDISGTWGFSRESYELYLSYFFSNDDIEQDLNSFAIYFKNEIKESNKYLYKFNNESKYLPEKLFKNQEFISPNTKNTLKESIRVINKLLRQYVYKNQFILESIMIETTWDENSIKESLNSENKKKEIIEFQNYNQKVKDDAEQKLREYNIDISESNILKMRLWLEQNGIDIYTGESIVPNKISHSQVDHIIPESISFNSHLSNLVLTNVNSSKGQSLPKEFIDSKTLNEKLIPLWKNMYDFKNKESSDKKRSLEIKLKIEKFKNLMTTREELTKINFINSNLSETTYAIRKMKDALCFYLDNFRENYKNKENIEFNLIKDCDVRTINGFITNKLRNDFFKLNEKDRNNSNHHSHDATMIAMFSSFKHINDFYNEIKNIGQKKYILNKVYGKSEKNIEISKLNNFVHNFDELKANILNSKCIYSFKKVTILSKDFKNKSHDEKWNEIKKIKPKQIFSNQNLSGYRIFDNKKYLIEYLKLNENKLNKNNDSTNKKLIILFKCIHDLVKNIPINNLKEIQLALEKINDKSITNNKEIFWKEMKTNWFDLFSLYKIINNEIDEIVLPKSKFPWIFNNYIEKLRNEKLLHKLKENINGITYEMNDKYINQVLGEYIPLINWEKNEIRKIEKIKYVTKDVQNNKLKDIKLQSKIFNKFVYNAEKTKQYIKNTANSGNETKLFVVLKYFDKAKEKIDIFKINQLNEIVDSPENIIEEICFIDPNKWYLINGEIYRVNNYNPSNYCLYIENKSIIDKKSEITKSFNSWSNYDNDKIQKEIFEKIICQSKKIL